MEELKMVRIEPVVDVTLSAKDLLSRDSNYFRSKRWYSISSTTIVDERFFPNNTCMLLSASDFYRPTTDDVGNSLVLEVEGEGIFVTKPVIPFPNPRRMIKIRNGSINDGSLTSPSFTVVTYNVLADLYATSEQFPNCPSFALKWAYRRQNLLKETLECDPDIICLQEVDYLVKHLEAYVRDHRDLTLLLCGDFNSLPGSAVHSFLTTGSVHPSHKEISNFDPSHILQFRHTIALASAYLSYSRCNVPLEDALKKIGCTQEPRFTNFVHNRRGKFQGTLDYILYSPRKLKVVSLLDLIDEDEVKDSALPSVKRSSDHIPIAAEFKFISNSKAAAKANKRPTRYGRNYR